MPYMPQNGGGSSGKGESMRSEAEIREYSEKVDWCAMCPAHLCLKGDRGCRCGVMDRKIPKRYEIEMTFPTWCPLKVVPINTPDSESKPEASGG